MPQFTIERLGHRGDGIAAGPVFAPLTLPGEVVEGEVVDGRILDPRIVTPSSDRVKAPCGHYRACGGCQLMHASDEFVANWKAEFIERALAAHGLDAPLRPVITSPPQSRRRASLAGRRTKKAALVGFHARRSEVIVPITNCTVLHPDLLRVLPVLEQITRVGASRSAELTLSLTLTDHGPDLVVRGGKPLDHELRLTLPSLARQSLCRLVWDDELVFSDAAPLLSICGAKIAPPLGAFLQATEHGEAALQDAVAEALGDAQVVADLFSGLGTFTFPVAQRARVHAVESSVELLHALETAAARSAGLKEITIEARDLFRRPMLPDELARFEAIVLDPPRAGAEAQVRELVAAQVPRVAMVSCNPITFARDTAFLVDAGYTLDWIQPVDQFRWSSHVELAAALRLDHIQR